MTIREDFWNAGTLQLKDDFLFSISLLTLQLLELASCFALINPMFENFDYGNEQYKYLQTHHISLN